MPGRIHIVAGVALGMACACSPHQLRDRDVPDTEIPAAFAGRLADPMPTPRHWWSSFEDRGLERAVDLAFEGNLGLRQAWARLDQARSQAVVSGSFLFPSVDLDASLGRSKSRNEPIDRTFYNDRYALGLGLSWEIDLWRKIANRAEAATLLANASRDDVENTALLLSGAVATSWFTVQEQSQLLALLEDQLRLSRTLLELTELRYGEGVGSALQVLQQRLQFESVEAQLPEIRIQLETERNELAILLGVPPESLTRTITKPNPTLPPLPPSPIVPSPRDLLTLRPDLRAAFARVGAADREVAAAIADMLPTIRLSLDGGYGGSQWSSLFDETIWSLTGSLLQPVFDADRRGAEADRRRAILQERLDAFGERFLIALREVEDAIVRENNLLDLLGEVRSQLDVAAKTLEESRLLFANGQIEYLDVITAIQSLQNLQRQEVSVERSILTNRTALHLAIGGRWTEDLQPSPSKQAARGEDSMEIDA